LELQLTAQAPTSRRPKLREVVFAHDYPFLLAPDGRVYSDRGDWTWHRYLDFADRVTVVSRTRELPGDAALEELTLVSGPGVTYESIPSLSGPLIRFSNRADSKRRLRETLSEADALIARLPSEIGNSAIEAADDLGKPWAVEVVTCTWDSLWNYGTWQGKVYAPISWWKTRRLVRRAPYAVYETQRFLQGRYPPGGKSVGCPIVELPEVDGSVLHRRLAGIGNWQPPLRVGLIGALSVGFKGIDTAIEALGRERANLPGFELRVLGAGDPSRWQRLAAQAGLAERVHFDGVLRSGEPVNRWLDDIDLYVQPSFQEGLPRGTLEAMSRGCPAVASTAGGLPELLESESLHKPGDAERLGRLIVRAARDRDWRRAQASRNFEVARRYSKNVLDRVRSEFWGDFAARVRQPA
jgi:glycosyltransferase involved in cell wall biosynthesis